MLVRRLPLKVGFKEKPPIAVGGFLYISYIIFNVM